MKEKITGFNTASGKCCCNLTPAKVADHVIKVSIPQAVSAVATVKFNKGVSEEGIVSIPQAVSAVATFTAEVITSDAVAFQYRKR